MKYGNTMANISNIYFSKSKEEIESFTTFLNRKVFKIKDFSENYQILKQIDKGNFGTVHLAKDKNTNELIAIKVYDKSNLKKSMIELIRTEIGILKILKDSDHPNVIKLIDVYEDKHHVKILTEYVGGGSLRSYLANRKTVLSEKEIKYISFQILKGLKFLNKYGIIHRDVKIENILITKGNSKLKLPSIVKIIDFGLSKITGKFEKAEGKFGTLLYSAPEILLNCKYDNKVDIWSFGVIIFYMATGTFPYDSHENCMIASMILNDEFNIDWDFMKSKFSPQFINLLMMCLSKNPDDRSDVDKIIDLKYWREQLYVS
jgi:serine/threonine protein kinase